MQLYKVFRHIVPYLSQSLTFIFSPSSLSHLISLQSSISLFKNLNSVELSGKMKISFPFSDTYFESEEIQQEFKEF